ncbi:hypothetical protein SAMN05518861_12023 [Mesorhizobium sp. YR577]|nr:hypothetical protein SAMN05518861_12023 [Mesorhizobium sp. YR577]
MQFGDFPFGQGDDADASELQLLVERGDIGLIAADPIQCLGQQDIELSMLRVTHEPLNARSQDRARAGDRGILIESDSLPPLPSRMIPTEPKLIFNRRLALIVGGIAGIQCDTGHG